MISSVRSTSRSPAARSRGRRLRAREYSVHTGLAHTMSKLPSERSSSCITSQHTVGRNLGSRSTLTTSQPSASKALPIEPVPLKSSRSLGIRAFFRRLEGQPDEGGEAAQQAGQLQIAQQTFFQAHGRGWRRLVRPRGRHFFGEVRKRRPSSQCNGEWAADRAGRFAHQTARAAASCP